MLSLEAGKAHLNPNEHDRAATCFFCGSSFRFQTGEIICCVRADDVTLPPGVDRHVCKSCAGAAPDALQARLATHVANVRRHADECRREADALDAVADTMAGLDVSNASRVWRNLF